MARPKPRAFARSALFGDKYHNQRQASIPEGQQHPPRRLTDGSPCQAPDGNHTHGVFVVWPKRMGSFACRRSLGRIEPLLEGAPQRRKAATVIVEYTKTLMNPSDSAMSFAGLPAFSKLKDEYPDYVRYSSQQVLEKIGGKVKENNFENTCAVRLSRTLNYNSLKLPPPSQAGGMSVVSGADGNWYAFRVN